MITDKNKEYLIGVFLARGKDALLWNVNSLMEESYNKGYQEGLNKSKGSYHDGYKDGYNKGYDSGYDDGNTRYK